MPSEPGAPPAAATAAAKAPLEGAAPEGPAPGGEESKRLHPVSILFILGAQARRLLLPAAFAFFAAGGFSNPQVWVAPLIFLFGLGSVVEYFFFRYTYRPDDLVIESGMIFRKRRHIPYGRIHNIASRENPLHRAFGVAEVRVETAGGEEPEARLRVLSLTALEEMRRRVAAGKAATGPATGRDTVEGEVAERSPDTRPTEPARTLVRLGTSDLLLHGLIDNRGMVVVGALFGLLWQTGVYDESAGRGFGRFSSDFTFAGAAPLAIALWVVGGLLAFLVTVRLLSIGWAFYRLSRFELRRSGRELTVESGLVTRVSDSVPLHRVQVVSIHETPLHRLFGRVEVVAETAGGNPSSEDRSGRKRLAPLLRREEVPALIAAVLPGIDLGAVEWRRVDPRGRRRMFKRWLAVLLLVIAASAWGTGGWSVLALPVLVPWAWWIAGRRIRRYGWAVTPDAVFFRSGALWHHVSVAFGSKIQAVAVQQSPFDRRYDMAELALDTAGAGRQSHRFQVPYLLRSTAERLYAELGRRAAATAFRW